MLLDPDEWSLAFRSDEVLARMPSDLRRRVTLETHAAVMEIATGVHHRVGDAVAELARLRRRVARALAAQGLRAAVAGTHPCAEASDTVLSSHPRYQHIGDSLRVLARREPTLATHVHIGVANPADAIRLLNGLRAHLPLLLALSANSPFWRGRPTGFDSTRTTLFDAFPRSGLPRSFRSYADWIATVERLLRSDAISDPSFLWWDVRLQPRYGTVEVRIMDAQTDLDDVAAIVALIQALASVELARHDDNGPDPRTAELIAENRFLAARDGMAAQLIDLRSGRRISALEQLERIISACCQHARRLRCEREIAAARRLARHNGAARQRADARGGGLRHVTARLAAAYSSV
jgi:carboxylate-amine ligase